MKSAKINSMYFQKFSPIIIGIATVLVGAIVTTIIHFGLLTGHQVLMSKHNIPEQLAVMDYRYANQGIALLVHSKSEITEIRRQQKVLFRPLKEVEYISFETKVKEKYLVLVKYSFRPKKEWCLELLNEDGYWTKTSPLFSESVNLSSQQWGILWNGDEKGRILMHELFSK